MKNQYLLVSLYLVIAGCGSAAMYSSRNVTPDLMREEALPDATHGVPRSERSRHLYLLLLRPHNAFTTDSEREKLWAALRGENSRYANLLGDLNDIPLDYRIEYVFNHTTPESKNAEMHLINPWLTRLSRAGRMKAAAAKTVLLVKGDLSRLPNAQDLRLTLAGLLFLAETYDGVVVDLLGRKAMAASDLRKVLETPGGIGPQIRLMGARVDGLLGVRTAGLPKYGFPDIFLPTNKPAADVNRLGSVVDALLTGQPVPIGVSLRKCEGSNLDFGCYRID